MNSVSGHEVFSAHTMDTVWVELAADSSAAHGPRLRIRLVSSQHPAVRQASIKAAYPQRTPGQVDPSARGDGQLSSRQSGFQDVLHGGAESALKQQPDVHDGYESLDEAGVSGKQRLAGVAGARGTIQDETKQKSALLQLQKKPKPGQKARKAELESIAAVLDAVDASLQADAAWDTGMMPSNELGSTAETDHRPAQLISCVASPCVALLERSDKRTLLQAFWELQLRMAKKAACADAALSLASSDHMMKLQSEMCDLSLEMSNVQKQLQVA